MEDMDNFSDPASIVAQIGLREGDHVADLGAGTGHYSAAAGIAVGSSGQVFAVEVQKDLLPRLEHDVKERGAHNVTPVWGDIEKVNGTRIREDSVDFVFVCNVLFQVEDRAGLMGEVRRILKPAGQVLVVDWSESFGGLGPQPNQVIDQNSAKLIFTDSGFRLVKDLQAGKHHYGFIASLI